MRWIVFRGAQAATRRQVPHRSKLNSSAFFVNIWDPFSFSPRKLGSWHLGFCSKAQSILHSRYGMISYHTDACITLYYIVLHVRSNDYTRTTVHNVHCTCVTLYLAYRMHVHYLLYMLYTHCTTKPDCFITTVESV